MTTITKFTTASLMTVSLLIWSLSHVWSQDEPAKTGTPLNVAAIKSLDDLANVGEAIFMGAGQCSACHSLESASSERGPSLKGVGAKLTKEFLYESLVKPDTYVYLDYTRVPPAPYPAPMPPVSLSDNEIFAVIAYLQRSSGRSITVELSELKR